MPCDAQPSRSPATIVSATAATWASVRPNRVSTACASARTSPSVIETIWVMSLLRQDFVFDQRRRHHAGVVPCVEEIAQRSEEHTSELQSLMRITYAVFCLKKK